MTHPHHRGVRKDKGEDKPKITAKLLLDEARDMGRHFYRKKIDVPGYASSGPRSLFKEAQENDIKLTYQALVDAFDEGWSLEAKENPRPKSNYEKFVDSIQWD